MTTLDGYPMAKAAISACIGLGIAMIGLDNSSGMPRFTFGFLEVVDGVGFLVAIVGLFAVTEVFVFIESHGKDNSQFGKGDVRGVAPPEAGNNAAAGGALIPMRDAGRARSGTTTVLLALLMTLNITPGPMLFTERPDVVWGLITSQLIANVVLLPGVTMVSFVGTYSLSGSTFDLLLMIGFGAMGFFLRKLDVPTVPITLGILLRSHMEDSLRRAMVVSGGEWSCLFSSGIAIGLWVAAIVGLSPRCSCAGLSRNLKRSVIRACPV